MDLLRDFLEALRNHGALAGHFRGLLHILIGRTVVRGDGMPVSSGMTWRAAAALLKKHRWDREAVRELGIDPASLPPRDRERFWYVAISQADLGSAAASSDADALAAVLPTLGFQVLPPRQDATEASGAS